MPRAVTDSGRIELRLRAEDKATLTRAATLKRLDLTGYILRNVLPQAKADICEAEQLKLSERDSMACSSCLKTRRRPRRVWCAPRRPASRFHEPDLGRSATRQAS